VKIGRRIYYEIATGNTLVDTGERQGSVIPTSVEQEVQSYHALHSRVRDTYNYIELEFGEYAQDFAECDGYRVNPETRTLEFSYPDANVPDAPPVYQKPLSEEVEELKVAQATTDSTVLELMETILLGGM